MYPWRWPVVKANMVLDEPAIIASHAENEGSMNAPSQRSNGFAMAVVVEGGLAVVAVTLAWLFRVSLREQFPALGAPLVAAVARGLLATLAMLLIFWLLVNSNLPQLRRLREQVQWLVNEMFPAATAAEFAMIATLAGVGEELLFRGVLQTKLAEWTTPTLGLLLASLLFGLAHALSKLYFAFAVAVGAFLGWLALEYNDLVGPMVAHGLYDFLALLYLARSARLRGPENTPSTHPE
jgi:membrane protease YdiL (CAAX protease family)